MPAGKWTLQVASKEQADLKATAAVNLSAGDVYSVVVLDAADGGLTLATHTDAVSAAVTPTRVGGDRRGRYGGVRRRLGAARRRRARPRAAGGRVRPVPPNPAGPRA